jgi:hypothetical protein
MPEATGLERHCHCERPARQGLARLLESYGEQAGGSVAISGIAELVPKRKRGISLLAMTLGAQKDEGNQSQ